jgi:hypothetical protein
LDSLDLKEADFGSDSAVVVAVTLIRAETEVEAAIAAGVAPVAVATALAKSSDLVYEVYRLKDRRL